MTSTTTTSIAPEQYLESHRNDAEQFLFELLRIPSVSADPAHQGDVRDAAARLEQFFKSLGLESQTIPTAGHPLVYAETPAITDAPVVLVYGHYDVQPPDPLELWKTPPFEPTVRDGNVYARGAADDKGQFLPYLLALKAFVETKTPLPIQWKFIIEGEEECGGSGLSTFIKENKKRLACDCILVSDTGMFAPGMPTITYGLRGIAAFELVVTGPNRDLHSGIFGGSVANPAIALSRMLSQLIDDKGKIKVPDFYKDVVPISSVERNQFEMLPFDEDEYFERIGTVAVGESGFTTNERRWARPTLDINGITSGYQGEGSKTIIPSKASAKFSFRLVPNQKPLAIRASLQTYLESIVPAGVTFELLYAHGAEGMVVDLARSRFVEPASRALEAIWGRPPVYIREGGSIPIVAEMANALGAETLLIGWGSDDDAIHSPNEKFSLATFHAATDTAARLVRELARLPKTR
ncbi:MAG: dipeptidase [Thermoguttaceae bacterium]